MEKVMDLNTIFIGLFGVIFVYAGYTAWRLSSCISPPITVPGFLVSQDTGKSKHIQSKTGDVSLQTELRRRRTVQTAGKLNPKFNALLGSVSGAIETYFITSICPCPCYNKEVIFDGGHAIDEFCPIHGTGTYDAGTAATIVCGI